MLLKSLVCLTVSAPLAWSSAVEAGMLPTGARAEPSIQLISSPYPLSRPGSYYKERAEQGNYGDTSGYPGGNEFDPSAPWGGQAAVTARPGTDAYKIEMQRRQRYCYVFSNRC